MIQLLDGDRLFYICGSARMALVEALMECKSLISEGMEKYDRNSTLLSGSGDVWTDP